MDLSSQSESDLSDSSLYTSSFIEETLSSISQLDLSSTETKKEIKFDGKFYFNRKIELTVF